MDIPQDNSDKDNNDNNSAQNGEPEAHNPAAVGSAAAPADPALPVNNEAPAASVASDAMKDLPVVEAPSIDAAQAEMPAAEPAAEPVQAKSAAPVVAIARDAVNDKTDEAATIELVAAPQARSFRFALLAATIALAAGVGALVGTLAATGVSHREVADAQGPRTADTRAVKNELAELNALKASLDAANRGASAQFAKIADRLASLERLQTDPAKLQRLADAIDRLDKRAAAEPEITGSIAKPAAAAPAPAAAPTPAAAHILDNWIVRDVRGGRALIESRYGGLFVVGSGGNLPGLGRVESVRRQDGAWIVVTAKGTITSDR